MVASSLLFASLLTLAWGKPTIRNLKPHEFLKDVPNGFSSTGSADPDQTLQLRLALVRGNVAELERRLYDVSTPSSSNYGKHLSQSEVEQLVAPPKGSVNAVNAWLKAHNITAETISPSGDWLSFEVPVSKANELFNAKFAVFKHDDTGTEAVRTLSYSIPTELQGHLDLVHPTVTFPHPVGQRPVFQAPVHSTSSGQNFSTRSVPSSCSQRITPACLQAMYNLPTHPATQSSNRIAVSGYDKQYAHKADLASFLKQYRPDMSRNTTFTVEAVDGGVNSQSSSAGFEASLDIQYTVGMATGVPTVFLPSGHSSLTGFLDMAHYLLKQKNPPHVWTTSYSFGEHQISSKFAHNLCHAYAQLGARGVSVIFSSADGGVSGLHLNNTCKSFLPTFPSGCPFVTIVGAAKGVPETAAGLSAGGFSNIWRTPSYQKKAVSRYLSLLGNTYKGRFNSRGRGFPDVAAHGVSYEIVVNGNNRMVAGTSAAAPVFASTIALLNDRLVAKGKKPLGFLNPFLYTKAADALNDITAGSNPGCGTQGFPAKKGWDPVTGLGTPDFAKLARAAGVPV
ncbi:family S53 protease [Ganoderma leucocontextum]|nr:family S53 protease [Ganoderma leucocontextum]